jgi:two-component system, LytTR family, response regulator
MNKISCVIIDDEVSGRIVLQELLQKFHPDIRIAGEAGNVSDAYSAILEHKPDFIFLDIQMPGGNGFELLKKFEKISFEIIFVTGFEKYAMNAIKFSALDYLLKPVDIAELGQSIEKLRTRLDSRKNSEPLIVNLVQNLESPSGSKRIAVHHQDKVKFLPLSEIICIVAESNYSHVYMKDGQKYTPARLLRDFEDFLSPHENFLRINKSVIVNLDEVTGYSKGEPCFLYTSDGKDYEIGRRKKSEVMERLKKE